MTAVDESSGLDGYIQHLHRCLAHPEAVVGLGEVSDLSCRKLYRPWLKLS